MFVQWGMRLRNVLELRRVGRRRDDFAQRLLLSQLEDGVELFVALARVQVLLDLEFGVDKVALRIANLAQFVFAQSEDLSAGQFAKRFDSQIGEMERL